ncbi:dihydrofolate synthase/folylpolyglutamate synthase [Bacillus ectoiniformans]|uniref:bifunctional folylpolyglutamate synthase/dihydrofolate synthase n=1 Tax=Bacillus ectoiniformans TaxID=1494429 RepID=UPI001957FDCB|nr:folylpolyglutamate synthase/dihydrofolate synthase family protein [Bacillus ectoiniformans]MBM7648928.1 dihydrofolate synthase/folylpolyglutamate synthase [Bacillus ectoiniformans]
MIHTYEEAINWIHGRLRLGIKPGLQRMEWMMERLNHPERHLKTIHVGGTNGKGSTVTYLRSILQESGYQVGTFTSPYIETFNERISVNGVPISDEEIIQLVQAIKPLAEELEATELGGPSEFEIITAMAFYYFSKINFVDVVIFEVGLGGRLDSTNIVHPLLSVITNIGMDHMQFLGDSIEQIAYEKAGIIKSGIPVITAVKQPEALAVIDKAAKEKRAAMYTLGKEFTGEWKQSLPQGEEFDFQSMFGKLGEVQIGLNGLHQVDNAALAVMSIQYLNAFYSFLVEEEHIRSGLEKAFWPGRMEIISETPIILLDGAHNPEGMRALTDSLKSRYPDYRVTAIFAGMKDKKLDAMINMLDQACDEIVLTTFDFPRAAGLDDFALFLSEKIMTEADWQKVVREFKRNAREKELLVVTGSLYFISEVKRGNLNP